MIVLVQESVTMVRSDFLVGPLSWRDAWKSALTRPGEAFATTSGLQTMPTWSAVSLDSHDLVRMKGVRDEEEE